MTSHNAAELAQTLFEEAGDALFLFDPDTEQILDVNPMAQRLTGFTRQEMLRLQVTYLFRAEARGGLQRFRQAFRKTGLFHSQEGFFLRHQKDGVWIPVNLTITRLHSDPKTLGLITARDVTEWREAQAQLRQKETELRQVMASVSDCLWSAEAEGGRLSYRYFSPVVERITGRPAEFYLPGPERWLEVVHPEDRPHLEGARDRAAAGDMGYEEEYRILRPDGEQRWVRDSVTFTRNESGRGLRLQGVLSDVTLRKQAELALQESRALIRRQLAQLEDVYRHTPVGLTFLDAELRYVRINDWLAAVNGRPVAEHLGRSIHEILPADLADLLQALLEPVLFRGEAVENRVYRGAAPGRPGEARDWMFGFYPHRGPDGSVTGVYGVVADVTEQRRVEEALRDSERRYRLLFERDLAGVFRSSADGRLLDCNNSFARILGHGAREEILAHNALDFYFNAAEREGLLARLRAEGQLNNCEVCLRRPDGTPVWVLENVSLLEEKGGPVLEGTIVDITAQKRTEEALRASEAKYRTVVENLDQSIFLKDAGLRFVAANPSFCRSVARAEADLVGKTDFDLYPHHLAEKYRADDLVVLAEGKHLAQEEENLLGGQSRTVRVVKTPVRDDRGRTIGVLGIFWDVTEQRALEAQLRQAQKMEAIGQLAGGVAHDFNNLLTVVLGNVSLLLPRFPQPDPQRELLLTAEQAALRAAELTRRLLGFSRRAMLRAEPINLNHCVEETLRILRRTIDPRIRVEVQARPDLWTVKADSAQVNQVLMNLCLNARDAMPEGGRLLLETGHFVPDDDCLRLHLEARPGEFVRLRVRDTGHGIAPEVKQHIFEPFFTTKEVGRGTGLGLAMVFGIVKQHHGWIDCESTIDVGTTFELYLPRHTQEAPAEAIAAARPAAPGRETILLVDDEPMIRKLGSTILGHHGYDVLLAGDGVEALEVYQQHRGRIDLVILDLTMPRLSGRDTLKRLVEMDPDVRVLFSSGYSPEQAAPGEFRQVRGFIGKPYRADELAATLRATLDQGKSTNQ